MDWNLLQLLPSYKRTFITSLKQIELDILSGTSRSVVSYMRIFQVLQLQEHLHPSAVNFVLLRISASVKLKRPKNLFQDQNVPYVTLFLCKELCPEHLRAEPESDLSKGTNSHVWEAILPTIRIFPFI